MKKILSLLMVIGKAISTYAVVHTIARVDYKMDEKLLELERDFS